jgi:hypothetical protein
MAGQQFEFVNSPIHPGDCIFHSGSSPNEFANSPNKIASPTTENAGQQFEFVNSPIHPGDYSFQKNKT